MGWLGGAIGPTYVVAVFLLLPEPGVALLLAGVALIQLT